MKKIRVTIFRLLFTDHEQTAIINALYRRVDDSRTKDLNGEQKIRTTCNNLANELMS